MGGYTSKCEKKSKSLHPNEEYASNTASGGVCMLLFKAFKGTWQRGGFSGVFA
jgi:hypothetical protein